MKFANFIRKSHFCRALARKNARLVRELKTTPHSLDHARASAVAISLCSSIRNTKKKEGVPSFYYAEPGVILWHTLESGLVNIPTNFPNKL